MNSTIRRVAAVVAVPAALTLALTACGGGAERPTADEISKSLSDGAAADIMPLPSGVPDEAVDCIAEVFEKSDLSDETLNALVEGDKDYEGSKEEEEKLSGIQEDMMTECEDVMTGQ